MFMTKRQLIDAIMGLNPTAAVEFLMSFDVTDLRRYFDHLQVQLDPRGRDSVWVRQADTPAVVWK